MDGCQALEVISHVYFLAWNVLSFLPLVLKCVWPYILPLCFPQKQVNGFLLDHLNTAEALPIDNQTLFHLTSPGLPWRSSGYDSALAMQGAQVRSLVRELKSHILQSEARKKQILFTFDWP